MEIIVLSSDDEEALSLRDLPLESQIQPSNEENSDPQAIKTDEDFNFVSLANSLSKDSQMCSADQLFFKGQVVPLCVLSGYHQSMVHGSLSRFTTASISNTNSFTASNTNSKAMNFRNKFNAYPSQPINVRIRNKTSSVWGFFRFGLVRAPELELHDRKSCVRRNSKVVNNKNGGHGSKGLLEKKIMGRYSGCKCSVNVVETVPMNNILFIKSNKNNEKKKAVLLEKKKLQLELKKEKK